MLKQLSGILAIIIFTLSANAQRPAYLEMMKDYSINFYTVVDSAEAYFQNHDQGKGSGYKPYLRWKYENEPLYYPSGNRMVDHYLPFKKYDILKIEQANTSASLFLNGGWNNLGPDTVGIITGHYSVGLGRLEFVEVNPNNSQQIYLGSRSGGLWRTNNNGATWEHHTDFLPASGVNTMAASPSHFDSVLINVRNATNGTSFGIYRSTDGGTTFTPTNFNPSVLGYGGLGSNFQIYRIEYHPRVHGLVFIGTNKGIFRSTNDLQTWTQLYPTGDITDIEFHPTNDNIVYFYDGYYWGSNKNRIFKSTNQGVSYTAMPNLTGNNDAHLVISVSPICPDCIFLGSNNGLWKSTDQGSTYAFKCDPPGGAGAAMVNDLDTNIYIAGYVDLNRSTNGGYTFTQCTWWSLGSAQHGGGGNANAFQNSDVYVHADCNYMDCVNGVFYACTDGYLAKSTDNGLTWQKLSNNNGMRENYCLGTSQSNHYVTICGSQDNGTSIRKQNGWLEAFGADGMEGIIHPLNENWIIGSYQYGGRIRTYNGGNSVAYCTPPGQDGGWVAPLAFDPNNHMTVYSFGDYIYKSTDFGTTWDSIGSPNFAGTISHAVIAQNNSNLIVAARNEFIELSTNGGVSFVSIKNNLPNLGITDVAFNPLRDSTIVVTYGDYQNNNNKIFISHNLGSSWQNITYNLNNMPLTSVVIDHTDSSFIYVGARIGLYKKSMNGNSWQLYNPELPNTTVNDLEINWGSNTLKAATWGRGLWEYSIANRNSFPAFLQTSITNTPTYSTPKVTMPQHVTSLIDYTGTLTSVFVRWAINTPNFTPANSIPMNLISAGTWKTTTPLPDYPAGTKMYFKVYAVGNAGDTTETYKFMYEVKPFEYCAASGTSVDYNLAINRFRCANVDNNNSGNTNYQYFTNYPVMLYTDTTYTSIGNFNTGWSDNDFHVWIDYDKDAEFTTTELVVNDLNTGSIGQANFTVPNSNVVIDDTLRMRVRLGYWGNSENPCGTELGEVEDYPVVIRQIPVIDMQVNSIYCLGDPIIIFYTGTAADSIHWSITNGTNTYTAEGNSVSSNNWNAGNYSVTLTAFKYGIAVSENFVSAFQIYAHPIINAGQDLLVCEGQPVTLYGLGNATFSWNNGVENGIPFIPSSNSTYILTGVNAYNCINTDTMQLTLYNVSASITPVNNNSLQAAPAGMQYQWINCDNGTIINGETNATFTPSVNGNFAVIINDANNCYDTSNCYTFNMLGIEEIVSQELQIYPNPSNQWVTVNWSFMMEKGSISLFDMQGRKVLSTPVQQTNELKISISHLATGMYRIICKNEITGEEYSGKIIRQNDR